MTVASISRREFAIAFLEKGRAEPPRGIHLKRKTGIALLDQGQRMNATGLVGMFAATTVRVSSETRDGDRGAGFQIAGAALNQFG